MNMNCDADCPILIRNYESEVEANGGISEYPKIIKLNKKQIIIGRSPSVDYCILSQNVSRIHAIIKSMKDQWFCIDRGSLNGVYINNNKIRAGIPNPLKPGDVVQFGNEVEPINLFTFRVPSIKRGCDGEESRNDGSQGVEKKVKQTESAQIERMKRKIEMLEGELDNLKKESSEQMRNKEKEFKLKNNEFGMRLFDLEIQLRQAKESSSSSLREMESVKERMNKLIMTQKHSDTKAIAEKKKLEATLYEKQQECNRLHMLMNGTQLKESSQKTNGATIVTTILESELQCSICNELFVNATTLHCSHTFCLHCITEWIKKKYDCPICRKPVTMFAPTLVLDAFVDKVLDILSPELKEQRLKTIAEKKQEIAAAKSGPCFSFAGASASVPVAGPSRRGTRTGRWNVNAGTGVEETIVIFSSDESSDDDFNAYSTEEAVEGIPGAYFGGYGECYSCGQPGHWSTGCPFR